MIVFYPNYHVEVYTEDKIKRLEGVNKEQLSLKKIPAKELQVGVVYENLNNSRVYLGKANEVFTYTLLSLSISTALIIIVQLFLGDILGLTGLSQKAKSVVASILLIRCFGILIYTVSTSIYAYLRSSGFDKQATHCRYICASVNILLDIIAIVFKAGVVGVALATTIAETVELLCILYIIKHNKKKIDIKQFKLVAINIKNYFYTVGTTLISHVCDLITHVLLTQLGDIGYACYNIVCEISIFTGAGLGISDGATTIVYTEFKDKVSNLYAKIVKMAFTYSFVYMLVISPLAIIVIYLFSYMNDITVNIPITLLISLVLNVAMCIAQLNIGYARVKNRYKSILKIDIINMIILLITITLAIKTNNIYICVLLPWLTFHTVKAIGSYISIRGEI